MINALFDLTGRTAVVVGAAAGGLGEECAVALSAAGATVALADLADRSDDLERSAQRCAASTTYAVDVTDSASVDALRDSVLADHGRVDVLVVASGAMLRAPLQETTPEQFRSISDVNVTGTWLLNRAFAIPMQERQYGRIVNVSTVYAERVGPIPESAYYASKAAVANLTRSVAAELGPHGITANCVAPGVFYPTRMTAPLGEQPDRLAWFNSRTMLGRLGDPASDLAGPLLLLASDASRYITGQILYVDGGWSAW